MECLQNIIRLSRTECDCYDNNKPAGYNEGKSDIYLDELEGLSLELAKSVSDCESGGLWDLLAKSRENAEKQFKADILSCIGRDFTSKRSNYGGLIGNTAFNSTLSFSQNMAGVKIHSQNILGGYLTLKSFKLMFNTTATFDIKIYSSDDLSTPIATYPVTSAANSLQSVSITDPLKLPLWSIVNSYVDYYVVYDIDGSFMPKNNKLACDCNKQLVAYKNWVAPTGIRGNNYQELSSFSNTTEMNGLALDCDLTCNTTRLICSDEYPLDFENDGRAMQMAYAVRFKAGEMLIESILSSGNINRYTMMDREALYGKRNRYRKLYEDWIVYLCENTEVLNSDCLKCRQNNSVSKGSILV